MALISYEQLEDNWDASANLWNERFGKIYGEFNGNIDSINIRNGAITREKIADGSVNKDKLELNTYIDANGWSVQDLGGVKTYSRQVSITGSGGGANNDKDGKVIGGNGARDNLWTGLPPEGRTTNNIVVVGTWYGRYGGHLVIAGEPRGDGKIYISGGNIWPAPLAFKGVVNIIATELN